MKGMKKVVFFIESFSGGGAERVLYTILRYIDQKKFAITILVMNDTGPQKDAFHSLGYVIKNVLGNKISLLNKIKYKLIYNILPAKVALKWLTKDVDADTYVAFVEGYCTKVFSHIPSGKRKVTWVHIDLDSFPWTIEKGIFKNKAEEKKSYSRFDEVICVSQEVTKVMRREYGINNARTIYNPIDEDRIIQASRESCDIVVDIECFNIISVGRLTRQKGYDLLIDKMPEIIAANPSIKLYIVGEGEERASLESQIQRLRLEEHVILTGFLQNPYSLMTQMDAFVCPSRAEGFSLVIAEAMIVGLPIASMECAGPCELLDEGKYGILCRSYDELAKSIAAVACNEELLESLRMKSQQRAKDFNTKNTIKCIEEIL